MGHPRWDSYIIAAHMEWWRRWRPLPPFSELVDLAYDLGTQNGIIGQLLDFTLSQLDKVRTMNCCRLEALDRILRKCQLTAAEPAQNLSKYC